MSQSEKMQFYFLTENKNKYVIPYSSIDDSEYLSPNKVTTIKCIPTIPYEKLS